MRPHDLRHSDATILLTAGEHPKVVQEFWAIHPCSSRRHVQPPAAGSDLMLTERVAAEKEAILSAGNKQSRPTARQSDPGQVVDQEKPEDSFEEVVTRTFASWNQIGGWLRTVDELRRVA